MSTPFMALTLPVPGVTNDLTGEQQIVAAFNTIDSHDHTSGKGVSVPISGLNVNADLPMTTAGTSFNITGVKALRLTNLSATPTAATDANELVDSGGNLYWMNSSGQAVQITAGAALSATSLGGISGLPSGTASASFGSTTFTWRSATNTAATMDGGPVVIRDTAPSALGVTIVSPASLASAYSLTLPTALPASAGLLSMSTGGVLSVFGTVSGTSLTLAGGLTLGSSAAITGGLTLTTNVSMSSATPTITATTAAAGLRLVGGKLGADGTGYDVLTNTTNTRTGGFLFGCFNNGTAALNVDYQGLLTLQTQATPLQPASLYTAITPAGTWGSFGSPAYWKDTNGVVHLKGGAGEQIGGSSANPFFTLPAGFRPATTRYFTGVGVPNLGGADVLAIWQITSGGAINLVSGSTFSLDANYLDGITFAAEG